MSAAELGAIAAIYIAGIVMPGPATLAIAAIAMRDGRRQSLAFAAGVWTMSVVWSLAAAFGLAAAMLAHAWILVALKAVGAAYLGWLAIRALDRARRAEPPAEPAPGGAAHARGAAERRGMARAFRHGFALHATNPKPLLFWGAVFTVVVAPGTPPEALAVVLVMCAALGVIGFGGHALIFSSRPAASAYRRARRGVEAASGAFFAAAAGALAISTFSDLRAPEAVALSGGAQR